jgi:hypothetical protein
VDIYTHVHIHLYAVAYRCSSSSYDRYPVTSFLTIVQRRQNEADGAAKHLTTVCLKRESFVRDAEMSSGKTGGESLRHLRNDIAHNYVTCFVLCIKKKCSVITCWVMMHEMQNSREHHYYE